MDKTQSAFVDFRQKQDKLLKKKPSVGLGKKNKLVSGLGLHRGLCKRLKAVYNNAMLHKEEVLSRIKESGLVAVVRAESAEQAEKIAEALTAGGVAAIEITFTVPGAAEVIKALSAKYQSGEIIIGAGTVLDAETARTAILAGAQYVVSPCLNVEMVKLCNRYKIACMPGAMTIKETVEAMEAGADVVKIFPGELFGPAIIKAIKGPLPHAPLMPTGGVSLDNVADWIKAGSIAVGVGSTLTAGAKKGDYVSITATAKQFIEKIKAAR